jgi:hypothetical protein
MHLKVHVFDKETLWRLDGVPEGCSKQEVKTFLLTVGKLSPKDRLSQTTRLATSAAVLLVT